MRFTETESEARYLRRSSLINWEDHCAMDIRGRNAQFSSSSSTIHPYRGAEQFKKMEYQKKLTTQGSGIRLLSSSYFSIESLFLLICLTATLLILPLILPPLPPPPFLLLLLPIGILAVLMILAFMPTSARDLTTLTNV